jgi:predicted Zn finger-like uncharacterized protein
MITRCPGCQTAFRITVEHLRPAHGQVQCGICSQQFDAIEYLIEEDEPVRSTAAGTPTQTPEPAAADVDEKAAAAPSGQAALHIDAASLEDESADLRFAFGNAPGAGDDGATTSSIDVDDSVSNRATMRRQSEDVLLADLPRMDVDRDEVEAIRHYLQQGPSAVPPTSPWWGVAAALLLTTLAGQVMWQQREWVFDRLPQARALWDHWCANRFCALPVRRDLQSLHVASRDVREHPQYADALLVNATVVNEAAYAQPFPVVELTLFDQGGSVIGVRRFDPDEYLDSSIPIDAGMKPGQPVYIVLELAGVGSRAVSFEFKFL